MTMTSRTLRAAASVLAAAATLSALACAPVDAGIGSYTATPVDAAGKRVGSGNGEATPEGISVTAGEVPGFSSPYLGAVRLVLSNTTSDFIRVDSVSVSFGEELDKHVWIPEGEDISGWGRAMAPRVWYWSDRYHVEAAYRPAHDIFTDIERFDQNRARGGQAVPSFPSDHLLAGPFSIPPGLSTIKWLLVKSDANLGTCLERMYLTLQAAKQPPQRLLVQFRDKALTQSEWQRAVCAAAAPENGWRV